MAEIIVGLVKRIKRSILDEEYFTEDKTKLREVNQIVQSSSLPLQGRNKTIIA
jgi:hypothetical protein